MPDLPRINELVEYLENTWISPTALFKRELWNHWDTKEIRTNNTCEGYNNRINRMTSAKNPNIFKVIELFRKEEILASNKLVKAKLGKFKKPITSMTLKNEKIMSLKKDLTNGVYNSNFDYLLDCFQFITTNF